MFAFYFLWVNGSKSCSRMLSVDTSGTNCHRLGSLGYRLRGVGRRKGGGKEGETLDIQHLWCSNLRLKAAEEM